MLQKDILLSISEHECIIGVIKRTAFWEETRFEYSSSKILMAQLDNIGVMEKLPWNAASYRWRNPNILGGTIFEVGHGL